MNIEVEIKQLILVFSLLLPTSDFEK